MDFRTTRELALENTHTNPNDYSEVSSIRAGNLVYQDMVDRIVVVTKGDYLWDTGLTDTVVNQSEYVAEKLGIEPDDLDIKEINKVFVKYDSNDEFKTKLRPQNPGVLEKHPDYYKKNQPRGDAFFYIQDESIFIYPAPTEEIVGGLELFVIHKPAALTINSTEDDIEIPSQFHKYLSLGQEIYIYKSQGKMNEAQALKIEYEEGMTDMTAFMKQRYNQPRKKTITGLDDFR